MGLDSIWDEEGNYLTMKSKGFRARSTGCSCCSTQLETEEEIRKEAENSLIQIIISARFFKWDWENFFKKAKTKAYKEMRKR